MHGSPLLRALLLTASLAVLGLLLSALAGPGESAPSIPDPAVSSDAETAAILTLQLSATANVVRLTALDGKTTLLQLRQPELDSETSLVLPLRNGAFAGLLSVTWDSPGSNNFLRMVLEPEGLESRELILHAPADLDQHAIEFEWPGN